ncbi:hypothetical protein [Litorihabitans aurantiacus]|uniref:Uncharacterized protein n=1 Tax=Litorihabitans aurantiacus TaxID=1930061 RepID=A0AA37XCW2_9MICO|nr:hypothetical protein [Litorihabitans aurantiacus]GMA30238.1 hypothetical protein GCM10025875_02300 [Litorihabitans aurantiacus]
MPSGRDDETSPRTRDIARAVAVLARERSSAGRRRAARTALAELQPSALEWARHLDALVAVAHVGEGPDLGLAQRAVHAVDDDATLPRTDHLPAVLATSAALLRRPAKGTARAALVRAALLLRGDGLDDRARGEVLRAVAAGLGHPAPDVARRARATITEHLAAVPDDVRADLAALLAGPDPTSADLDAAPAPRRHPWPVSDASPGAVRDLVEGRARTLVAWESGLAALVHLHATDPGALRAAVADVRLGREAGRGERDAARRLVRTIRDEASGVRAAVAGLVDAVGALGRYLGMAPAAARGPGGSGAVGSTVPHLARLAEVADLLRERPVPRLLATPTHDDGSIDPATLLARITAAAREGWEPWPVDTEAALLRLTVPLDVAPLRAAGHALGTGAGHAYAAWLGHDGLVLPRLDVAPGPPPHAVVVGPAPAGASGPLAAALLAVPDGDSPAGDLVRARRTAWPPLSHAGPGRTGWLDLRPLPHHPELAAAWLLPHVSATAASAGAGEPDVAALRTVDGDVGAVTAAVLAHLLLGERPARDEAVALARHLSGRRQPWGALTGEALVVLVPARRTLTARLVEPLRAVAAAGGGPGTLVLLVTVLPALLTERAHGLPDLLALTSSLLETHGAPEHAGAALRSALRLVADGDSMTAREAARLLAALPSLPA